MKYNILIGVEIVLILVGCSSEHSVNTELIEKSSQSEPVIEIPDGAVSTILPIKSGQRESSLFDLVTESNLFSSDRSFSESDSGKSVEPTPMPKQSAVELDSLKLVGTISTDQGDMFAFIINKKDSEKKGKTQRVARGEKIGEYTLEEIKNDRVVLRNGDNLSVVFLKPTERAQGGGKSGGTEKTGKDAGKRQQNAQNQRPAFEKSKDSDNASIGRASGASDRPVPQMERSVGKQMEETSPDQKPDDANEMQKEHEAASRAVSSSATICGGNSSSPSETQMCGR